MGKKTVFILCDGNNVNSYGFRTDVQKLVLDRFKANPVMLFSHDSDKVIGRWENTKIEDGKLTAEAVFDTDDEDAKKIAGKVERGFLKGCSIGMMVLDVREDENSIPTVTAELLEASICALPSDSHAIRLYDKNMKQLTVGELRLQMQNNTNLIQTKMTEKELKEKEDALEAQLSEKDKKITELEAKIAEKEKQAVDSFLDAAVSEGKIAKEEKENFAKLAVSDFATVKSLVESRQGKPSVSLAEMVNSKQSVDGERANWTYMEWMKKDSEGLARLKAENPKEFERLQQTL